MKATFPIRQESGNSEKIFDYLEEKGFSTELYGPRAVLIRECKDISRHGLAMRTGTDRDKDSRIWNCREEIERLGLGSENMIYATVIGMRTVRRGDMLNVVPGWFYLLYDHSRAEEIRCKGKVLGDDSWKVADGFTFYDALIASIIAER